MRKSKFADKSETVMRRKPISPSESDRRSRSRSSSSSESKSEDNEGYRQYKKLRDERRKMRSIIAKDRLEQQAKNSTLEIRKVDLKDFPNSKKKLVVQNIPLDIPE